MAYFLAIEAGSRGATAVLADETRVLATAKGGGGIVEGQGEATERLGALLADLSARANVGLEKISRTCMGIAGNSSAREWAERVLREVVAGEVDVCGAEELGLDGAFEGEAGILADVGTGSKVVGRVVVGELVGRYWVGGWGPVLGDEGSAYWIGVEAVKAVLWGRDRGVPTVLLDEIQVFWGLESLGEVVEKGNGQAEFASLAPVVAKCAEGGDELALAVMERAGQELAEQVALVHLKMMEAGDMTGIRLAYTGSVLEISIVLEAMIEALKEAAPGVKVMDAPVNLIEGALWRARVGV